MRFLVETYASLLEAKSEAAWCEAMFALARQHGFESAMFAVVPRPGMALEDAFLRSNYSRRWRSAYDRQGMAHYDPTVGHCLTRTTPLVWSPEIFSSRPQQQMYEEASGYGLRSGLTLPIHGPRGEVGILCFVTDRQLTKTTRGDMAHHLPNITLLRDVAFDTCQPYLDTYTRATLPALTPREKECLRWTAAGKTSWDLAQIFHCTEATVAFHMANIRRKLGVNSRRAAAVKAVRLGLILPP